MKILERLGQFYIGGEWVVPGAGATRLGVENPATEEILGEVAIGSVADADRAIMAARAAFSAFSALPGADRIALLRRVHEVYLSRAEDLAQAMSAEMGAPIVPRWCARRRSGRATCIWPRPSRRPTNHGKRCAARR